MFRLRLFSCCVVSIFGLTLLFLATINTTLVTAAEAGGKPIQGKVLETMDAGGYTYLHLQAHQGDVWVAIPETRVPKGQQVTCQPGMTMTNFTSKSLGRTFKSIIFSSGLSSKGATAVANPHAGKTRMNGPENDDFAAALQAEQRGSSGIGHAAAGTAMGGAMMASGGSASAIVPSKDIKVDKAEGNNAYTVGECFNQGKKLNNKEVMVRGKVVKVSRMIMGKNWVHIQDGTGNPMKNTHDLVVTTMADPKLDSVVIVKGTLHADKDFGAGYKYKVIIEDAEIK